MKNCAASFREKMIMLCLLLATGVMALYVCLLPKPAQAFVGGVASTVNSTATAATTGYGASAAASAADDDDD